MNPASKKMGGGNAKGHHRVEARPSLFRTAHRALKSARLLTAHGVRDLLCLRDAMVIEQDRPSETLPITHVLVDPGDAAV
jgi:hypothetical protein